VLIAQDLRRTTGAAVLIGQDIPRLDGLDKLAGRAAYVDDLALPGVWHGGTVRSPIPRGRIKRIHFDPAVNWREFVVVDHRDIPGRNEVKLIDVDQPALVASEFKHKHEPILVIAHRSIHKLRDALRAVRVEVEPLATIFDPRTPLTPELIQYKSDNVFKRIDIRKGSADILSANHADVSSADAQPGAAVPHAAVPHAVVPQEFERIFARAAHVVEGEYVTGPQEHVYIETQGMVAHREDGRLVVCGSMQCPYYVLDALVHLFGRPRDAFRVVQTPIGGGFGGKEDYPSLIAIHAALLAEKAGAPVKIVYDRQEDMAVTTKRHPSRVRHRTALDRDGRLLAMQIDVLLDGGAYVTLSPVVLSRGCIHAAGPYFCEHIHIHGEARLTNSPPYGAFRGFGAPQTLFAVERHMDEIARRIGMDPAELRRRNLLRAGQALATGQVYRDGTDLVALLDRALGEGLYEERRKAHAMFNRTHPYLRRGIGMATFFHGSGFTGAGETYLASEVWLEALPDGTVEVLTAQTDMGQGTTTILAQIAANRLGLPPDCVCVAQPDTSRVPNSGPTVASRTAMIVGRLIEQACDDLLGQLSQFVGGTGMSATDVSAAGASATGVSATGVSATGASATGVSATGAPAAGVSATGASAVRSEHDFPGGTAASAVQTPAAPHATQSEPEALARASLTSAKAGTVGADGLRQAIRTWHAAHPGRRLVGRARYTRPDTIQWDDANYRGDAYAAYSWAADVAEVEVDLRTYRVRVTDFVAVQEVGRVVNPTLATGQVQGGVAQAIGWALYENVVLEDGVMKNCQMTNYIIPASSDLPPIRVLFEEVPSLFGPGGAKGIGEMPIDGPAPAVINAVCEGLRVSINEIPLTPERLMERIVTTTEAQRHTGA